MNLFEDSESKETEVIIDMDTKNKETLNANSNKNDTDKTASKATVGFVLGLISIIAWILPLIGYPITIAGIIFSSSAIHSKNRGKAIAGLILSIICLIATLINSILGVLLSSMFYYSFNL